MLVGLNDYASQLRGAVVYGEHEYQKISNISGWFDSGKPAKTKNPIFVCQPSCQGRFV